MKPFSTPAASAVQPCNSTGGARAMSYHGVRMNTPSVHRVYAWI